MFLHARGSTSQLLFSYAAAVAGFPVTQLNPLVLNQQMPPVCTSQDAARSQGSFFSHLPIGSPFVLSQNRLLEMPLLYSGHSWCELFASISLQANSL